MSALAHSPTPMMRQQSRSSELTDRAPLQVALDRAGFGVVDCDLQRGSISLSPGFERMLGYEPGTMPSSAAALRALVHPDDVAKSDRRFDELVSGRAASYVSEHRIRSSDGSYRWVIVRGASADIEPQGPPRHVTIVCIDASPREPLAAALDVSRQRFALAFERSAVGMAVVGLDGRFLAVNHALTLITHRPRPVLLGMRVQELTPEAERHSDVETMASFAAGTIDAHQWERRYFGPDGQLSWIHVSSSLVRGSDGTPDHVIAHVQDVTSGKRAELELRASLAEKEVLLHEVHHRVKNNLQIVSSLLRLQVEPLDDPRAQRAIAESLARIEAIAALHEKVYRAPDLGHVGSRDYLEDLVHVILRAQGNPLRAGLCIASTPLTIAVGVPLGLIVNELVTNALKHAFASPGPECRLTISLEVDGPTARLSVCDDGVGLPEDFSLQRVSTVGLSLVRCMVRQLHGTISMTRDEGTCFRIEFPLIEEVQP